MTTTAIEPKKIVLNIYHPKKESKYSVPRYVIAHFPEREIGRDANGSIIEVTLDPKDKGIPTNFLASAITLENRDAVVATILQIFENNSRAALGKKIGGMLRQIIFDWYGYSWYDVFDIEDSQQGIGFMGGTGVGEKIHRITYSKVTGVRQKPALPEAAEKLANYWLANMTGSIQYLHSETKHMRDHIKAEDLCVVFEAQPDCQKTVAHWTAQGYPIKGADSSRVTCARCKKAGHK